MKVLITGATGFVMSNVAHRILTDIPDAHTTLLDINESTPLVSNFFSEFASRTEIIQADITDEEALSEKLHGSQFSHVIHAAAITHDAVFEQANPTKYIDVNLIGTVNTLEWIRRQKGLQRYIHVSTGGVYGNPSLLSPLSAQPETGPFDPPELYAVSKYAAELTVRRYGEIFNLPQIRVRFADVFGPMERPTGARRASSMSCVYHMMRAAIEERPLRITPRTLETVVDLTSAQDIASGIMPLLTGNSLPHDVFNISAGRGVNMEAVFQLFRSIEPHFEFQTCDKITARIDSDPFNSSGRYNVYDTSRISALGWNPRSLLNQLDAYRNWVRQEPEIRCPPLFDDPANKHLEF